jgi:hypothetical protein
MKTLFAAIAILIGTISVNAQRGGYGRGHNEYRPVYRNYGPAYRPHAYFAPRPFYRPVPLFVPRPLFFPPVIGVHINTYPPVRHVYSETYVERQPAAAMSDYDFNNAKNSIYTRTTDDGKVTVARQVADNNYLTSAQVRDMLGLFNFDDSRLQFAEYAYSRVVDPNNYYMVNDAFTYESSIKELDNYIRGRR